MRNVLAILAACTALAACSVVDLVAHGVKEYEQSRQDQPGQTASPAAQPAQPSTVPVSAQAGDPGAAPVSPAPSRQDVRVETLN